MAREELKKKVEEILKKSRENKVINLTMGCFLDNNCDITKCRSDNHNITKKCCPYYENKCRFVLEPLIEEYNEKYRL